VPRCCCENGYDARPPSVEQARRATAEAGFAQVRHVEMDNPFNRLYELTR
jgi:hypothetical protein